MFLGDISARTLSRDNFTFSAQDSVCNTSQNSQLLKLMGCFGLYCGSNQRSVHIIFIVKGRDNGSNKNAQVADLRDGNCLADTDADAAGHDPDA